jgi:hypothetical protein
MACRTQIGDGCNRAGNRLMSEPHDPIEIAEDDSPLPV